MDRIEKLKAYLEKSPLDSFLRHALGLEYIKSGLVSEARAAFEKVLEHDPKYIGTYYQLAKLLEQSGETDEAIKVYESGIEMAKALGENHARNELQAALDNLE